MAEKNMTNAQLQEMVLSLSAKMDALVKENAELKEARSKKGGAYQRKIRDGLKYAEHNLSLTWIQALILDHLVEKINPVSIKMLASGVNALRYCDVENGIGRIKFGDSGLEAQFRAVLTGMQVKGLIQAHRGDKLAYSIADFGATVWSAVQEDIKAGGLANMFLYPERVTDFAWSYLKEKYGAKEENNNA